jgi:enediyne biosynthesis protein E4
MIGVSATRVRMIKLNDMPPTKIAPGTWLRTLRPASAPAPSGGRARKAARVLIILVFMFIALLAIWRGLAVFSRMNLLADSARLLTDVEKYGALDMRPSSLPSRRWMNLTIQIVKDKSPAPPMAARMYAYVASAYADGLKAGGQPGAGRAAAEVLKLLVPEQKDRIERTAKDNLAGGLTPEIAAVIKKYSERMKSDHADLAWDKTIPGGDGLWYIRDGRVDGAAKAGEWERWLTAGTSFEVPPPPVRNSFEDKVELAKVEYAAKHRSPDDLPVVLFWHGTKAFVKGQLHDNITPAGVWQNILFAEAPDNLSDEAYAEVQKNLAQTIADAFIECWDVKYSYWVQRPSMRIKDLETVVADPPFPSYVSGHATISAAAATLLAGLLPEQRAVWEANAKTAAASRLVAGIHFDSDNQNGLYLGGQIGLAALKSVAPDKAKDPLTFAKYSSSGLDGAVDLTLMKLQSRTAVVVQKFAHFQPWHRASFRDALAEFKIEKGPTSYGVSWQDVDGDGWTDLALFGGRELAKLYQNDGQGGFRDMTHYSGLDEMKDSPPIAGVFGDYDNDGCPDLYLTRAQGSDSLLRNDCRGRFTNVSAAAGIRDSFGGFGAAWTDYDKDGWLDIYVANYGLTKPGQAFPDFEPNLLWRNNGDGTFTEVAARAGVAGLSECQAMKDFITEHGKPLKESYQPVWFDYNNDGWPDLFVSTDSGVSPLYLNNKDGTFTEVTEKARMCKIGTGMGVAVGDYDGNGWLDLYVTNTGRNFLWRNNGDSTFTSAEVPAGVDDPNSLGWGTAFLDFDNDGDLDLYVVNGDIAGVSAAATPQVGKVRRDRFYANLGNGMFAEMAEDEGILGDDPKEAAGVSDYDRNGTLDMFVMASFLQKNPKHRFYVNEGSGGHWLELKLTASKGTPLAIGARITLTAGGATQIREIAAGGSFVSQHDLVAHFGLGDATKADAKIRWPDGTEQELKNIAADQLLEVRQP